MSTDLHNIEEQTLLTLRSVIDKAIAELNAKRNAQAPRKPKKQNRLQNLATNHMIGTWRKPK